MLQLGQDHINTLQAFAGPVNPSVSRVFNFVNPSVPRVFSFVNQLTN